MKNSPTAQRFVEDISKKSGVDANSVTKVLEVLGLPRLVDKLTALDATLSETSNAKLGPIAPSADALARAVKPSALRFENLKLEYRIEGIPHGDGFAGAVAQ